jgi:hypothetical protein
MFANRRGRTSGRRSELCYPSESSSKICNSRSWRSERKIIKSLTILSWTRTTHWIRASRMYQPSMIVEQDIQRNSTEPWSLLPWTDRPETPQYRFTARFRGWGIDSCWQPEPWVEECQPILAVARCCSGIRVTPTSRGKTTEAGW